MSFIPSGSKIRSAQELVKALAGGDFDNAAQRVKPALGL